ncbi:MAG: CHAD domain-containing protein [Cyanobacteria bacterium J06621_11]
MTKATELTTKPSSEQPPLSEDSTRLGGYAYQIIRHQSKQIFKRRAEVLADTDIENLHQMRIGTRRLRSALLLFADVIEEDVIEEQQEKQGSGADSQASQPKKGIQDIDAIAASVKQLTGALGKVRDIDVMQKWFAEAADRKTPTSKTALAFSKSEQKTINSLLKKLKKRRKQQFSKMEKVLKSSSYKKLKKQCKQWLKRPTFSAKAEQSAADSAVEKIIVPVTELLQHSGWQIATHQKSGQLVPTKSISLEKLNQQLDTETQQLHDLRKKIKQVRYQTEFFRSIYGITYASQIREFRSLQKVLGQLQDQLVISEFLTQTLGDNWAKKLPTIHDAFQSSRLELWQQWQPLQEKYLGLRANLKTRTAA